MSPHTLHRTAALCAFVVVGAFYLALVLRALVALGELLPAGLRQAAAVALGLGALALLGLCMGRPR